MCLESVDSVEVQGGFFFCAVINKRRYLPSVVPGKDMEDHVGDVEVKVGETDYIQVIVDDVI